MARSSFVKPCKKCKGSGETSGLFQKRGICPKCNGTGGGEVDYDYLFVFEHEIWEQAPNEKIPSLLHHIEDGIKVVENLQNRDHELNSLLAKLYYMRGQSFKTIAVLENEPAYFIEAVRNLMISHELGEDCSNFIRTAKSVIGFNSYKYDQDDQEKAIQVYKGWHPNEEVPSMTRPEYP